MEKIPFLEYSICMHVTLAIITHHCNHFVDNCLQSIVALNITREISVGVVVVISNDQDVTEKIPSTTMEILRSTNIPCTIHWLGKNVGYAHAVNWIFSTQSSHVFIVNDDTLLDVNCITELARFFDPQHILQPQIRFLDAPDTIENVGHRILLDGSNDAIGRGQTEYTTNKVQRMCFSGAAFFIPKEIYSQPSLSSFDPELSPFGEDLDYALRCVRQGYKITYIPTAIVYHKLGASFGTYSRRKLYYVEKHRIQAKWRSLPFSMICVSPFSTLRRYMQGSSHPLIPADKRIEAGLVTISAIIAGYTQIPKALRKRLQDTHVLSDGQFWKTWWEQP